MEETRGTVIELRDGQKFPFAVDEESGPEELRILRLGDAGEVVGDFIFAQADDGDVLVVCRRYDESQFGTVNFVLV